MREIPSLEYNIGEQIANIENRADTLENEGNFYGAGLALYNFAEKIRKVGKIDDVVGLYERAQDILEKSNDNETIIEALELAGRANRWIGGEERARILFHQAANIAESRAMKAEAIRLYRLAESERDIKRLG